MKEKTNNLEKISSQIEYLDAKMKIVNKELDNIKKINQVIILNIQEIIEKQKLI